MNGLGIQSSKSNQFVPPPGTPLLGFKSMISWGHNILTLGIYPSASTLANEHYIRKLELIQDDLYKQIGKLDSRWNDLEKQLTNLLGNLSSLDENDSIPHSYKHLANHLQTEQKNLVSDNKLNSSLEVATSIREIALGPIVFIGQLVANILTLGLYGVCKNNVLKNRIELLKAQNHFIQNDFTSQKDQKTENLQKIITSIHQQILFKENTKVLKRDNKTLKEQLDGVRDTDAGNAYFTIQTAQKEIKDLKSAESNLNLQINALKLQKINEEVARVKAQNELSDKSQAHDALAHKQQDLEIKCAQLQAAISEKDKAYSTLQQMHADLTQKASKVDQLQKDLNELNKVKNAQAQQPEIVKLASQLGPIPPKYTATAIDGESLGAMDLNNEDVAEKVGKWTEQKVTFASLYNKRYGEGRSAPEIAVASFNYACDQLFMMRELGDKIQLNNAGDTPATFGRFAIYRFMALDLIKGGKIKMDGCNGPELLINDHVRMLPSYPENVMQYKQDAADRKLKPIVQLRYKQRDDFTPSENALGLRDGVHPVAVKWILDQLTDEEKGYLFTHLMAPVIPDSHPDYVAMKNYLRIKNDFGAVIKTPDQVERIKLVSTASELIQDIATAFQKKFEVTSLIPSFQDKFDEWDIEPYIKEEDNLVGLDKVPDEVVKGSRGPKNVDWELDEDVLSDKSSTGPLVRQRYFLELIEKTRHMHTLLSPYIGEDLLISPKKPGEVYPKIDWPAINSQYHISHQMIGADPKLEFAGGERCLFSNLIAILVSDVKDITSKNVQAMKNAMAHYLSKLMLAKAEWSIHPDRNKKEGLSEKASKMKELAELAWEFEKVIKSTHNCSVELYQKWLRNDIYEKPNINVSNLTSLEIQLAAYTIGVRIALLPINIKGMGCKVDALGRILPEAEIYGPNTQELLYMGIWDDKGGEPGGKGTYYGLYPKFNLKNELLLEDSMGAYDAAQTLEKYWVSIKP